MRRKLGFLAAATAIWWVARALRRAELFPVRVEGESMRPTLLPGDLLAATLVAGRTLRRGSMVLARDRSGRETVKRVSGLPGDPNLGPAQYWLLGDNSSASTDSRAHGPYDRSQIVGIVRLRYWPPSRARLFTS